MRVGRNTLDSRCRNPRWLDKSRLREIVPCNDFDRSRFLPRYNRTPRVIHPAPRLIFQILPGGMAYRPIVGQVRGYKDLVLLTERFGEILLAFQTRPPVVTKIWVSSVERRRSGNHKVEESVHYGERLNGFSPVVDIWFLSVGIGAIKIGDKCDRMAAFL